MFYYESGKNCEKYTSVFNCNDFGTKFLLEERERKKKKWISYLYSTHLKESLNIEKLSQRKMA